MSFTPDCLKAKSGKNIYTGIFGICPGLHWQYSTKSKKLTVTFKANLLFACRYKLTTVGFKERP